MNARLAVALAATLFCLSPVANAATLGLTPASPSLSASTAIVDYFEIGSDGDLSVFGAAVDGTEGITLDGPAEIGLGIGFPLADPTTGASGGLDVFEDGSLLLGGTLTGVGFTENTIELSFADLDGSAAAAFGSAVVALIAFDDELGADPFAALTDGDAFGATISIATVSSTAVIPVPPALSLLSLGLGAIWFHQRLLNRNRL